MQWDRSRTAIVAGEIAFHRRRRSTHELLSSKSFVCSIGPGRVVYAQACPALSTSTLALRTQALPFLGLEALLELI